jgi:hypothetical protein
LLLTYFGDVEEIMRAMDVVEDHDAHARCLVAEDLIEEAQHDRDLLKLPLPIEEAWAIWVRAREGLQWLADHCPERRVEIEAFLAERERKMAQLHARLGRH